MRDGPGRAALVAVLLGVMALELMHLFSGLGWARAGAHLALGAVVLASMPRFGLREVYLLCLSGVLAGLLWVYHPDPGEAARKALDQAVFLMAFVLLISLVQEAAMTSPSVAALGMYLARQPGGRRFAGMFGGTMVMAVIFNIGTISLLAPLVRRAAEEAADDPLTPVRERRQLNAVLRGFAWSVIWSPTAIAPLALMGLIDGIERGRWIVLGLILSLVMLGVGWLEDRIAWRNHTAAALGLPPVPRPALPRTALWRFLGVCAALAGLTGAVMAVSGLGVPASLMLAAPVLLLGWLAAQDRALMGARLGGIVAEGLPASAPMAVTLGCSGFVGIAGAALLPAEQVAAWIGLDELPAWVFLIGCTLAVTALSQFALSPIMMAVFFGAVLGSLPSLPADPTLTALAVSTGWAVSTTFSPFASGAILLSRMTGHPGSELTYGWNTIFAALSVAVLTLAFWLLTGGA